MNDSHARCVGAASAARPRHRFAGPAGLLFVLALGAPAAAEEPVDRAAPAELRGPVLPRAVAQDAVDLDPDRMGWKNAGPRWLGKNDPREQPAARAVPFPAGGAATPARSTPSPTAPVTLLAQNQAAEQKPAATAKAQPSSSLPKIEELVARLEEIKNDPTLDEAAREPLVQTLEKTLAILRERADDAKRAAAIDKQLSGIPKATEEAQAAAAASESPDLLPPNLDLMLIEELRQARAEADAAAAAARQELQEIESAIAERQTRKEALPRLIQQARKDLAELESAAPPTVAENASPALQAAHQAERAAALAAAKQKIETLVTEQSLLEANGDLLPLQREAAAQAVADAERVLRSWSQELQQRRQSQIEAEIEAHRQRLIADGIDPERSIVLSDGDDLALADDWLQMVGDTDEIAQRKVTEDAEYNRLQSLLNTTREKIDKDLERGLGGLRPSVGLELQLLNNELPSRRTIRSNIEALDERIEQARTQRMQLELLLGASPQEAASGPRLGLATRLPTQNGEIHPSEQRLLEDYINDLESHVNGLIKLRSALELKRDTTEQLHLLIDSHVMWIPNASRFGLGDFYLTWQSLQWIFHPNNLKAVVQHVYRGLIARLDLLALVVVSIVVLVFGGSRMRRRLSEHGRTASGRHVATFRPTWLALLLTMGLSLPPAVLYWAFGEALEEAANGNALIPALAAALQMAAVALLPLELVRQLLRNDGLALAHFGVEKTATRSLRLGLRVLLDLGVPLLIIWRIADSLGQSPVEASLGRLTFVLGMGLVALLLWQAFHPRSGLFSVRMRLHPEGWLSKLRHVWFVPLVISPLVLAGLSLNGYAYAATALTERFYWTLWLCIAAYIATGLIHRWLLTQRRRLAMAVHRENLEEAERIEMGGFDVDAEANLGAAEINAQTQRLTHVLLATGTLIGVAVIWSPVLPAVHYLEDWTLWNTELADGTIEPVTLANLIMALPILVLTFAAVRNLPGLIENVLLERLPIERAARYAVTTLASYVLAGIGLLWSAQVLGLRWEGIQWLVAALGVGLGFGLQEIFANFISGLILLFEQPIRVGDVVTLGDTTGVVSKIRIRATTVTNWDRQELVIPNKDLITGRLINWTLSDSTNRITINVGVAYGSDTKLACTIMEGICAEHRNIANDPPPLITFEGFGDSSLQLVMRCFLASMEVRLETISELHSEINQRFSRAGIEIAFPQRDLHLRSLPPELLKLITQDSQESDRFA